MSQSATLKMKKRLNYLVITAIVLAFCILAGSLINIAVLNHDFYVAYAENRQMRPETIPANRGSIYDRNMSVLSQSATVWDVTISPRDIAQEFDKDKPEEVAELEAKRALIAKTLSDILKVDYEKVLTATKKSNSQYEIIKKKVEKDVEIQIREAITTNEWTNEINLVENTKRYYPNSTMAASLLGFTGNDGNGLYGLEYQYDGVLSGTPGYIVSLKNGHSENIAMSFEEKHDPIDGSSLVLTLDETIQRCLEKTLNQVMAQHKPTMGCAGIVMNVNTGDILAMANMPTFDVNQPWYIYDDATREAVAAITDEKKMLDAKYAAQQGQWKNKAISYDYEPGSTFKTIVASSALEERTSGLNSSFSCHGFIQVADQKMACHIGVPGHGHENFTDALVNSCNPAFVKIGSDLGSNLFYKYFQSFGLTEKTGIDLPGEAKGAYITPDKMGKVELASVSFGQSTTITAIQLVTAISAVVNGGNLVTPHVVKDVLDSNGNVVKSVDTEVKRQAISEETSKTLRTLMETVVETKKASNAYVRGYRIGGKSGTSQKQKATDSKEDRIASYIGVAPINNPEIAVYIMADIPTSGDSYGSTIAAPAVASVLSDILPYLGYSPSFTEEEIAQRDMIVPHLLDKKLGVIGAEGKLAAAGFAKPKIIGDGVEIIKQVPSSGSKMPKDGTVILYTDNSEEKMIDVPNVVGLQSVSAKQTLVELGFNVVINGESLEHKKSKISTQSAVPETKLPIGSVIELTSVNSETD